MYGCTKLGPDFHKEQSVKFPKAFQKQDANVTQEELASWWSMFHDATLDVLIHKAYANNYDIKQAALRILQSRTLLGVSEGFQYPQVQTLSGSATSTYKNSATINNLGLNFDVGWEIDFWGKYARNIESAEANLYLSVASYRDIMTTVVAEVARNYISYRVAQERIVYAKRNIAIQQRVTKMTEVQFNAGNVSELDMQQARTQLYTTRAKLPSLELSKIKARNALALLLGISFEEIENIVDVKSLKIPSQDFKAKTRVAQVDENVQNYLKFSVVPQAQLKASDKIAIHLLQRRADVEVAEYKARSASAKIGSTTAQLYPSFQLIGNVGLNSSDIFGGFASPKEAFSVTAGPGFSWNIFQYDRIKNQIRFEDARFEEAMLGYNKTLLRAINELSNAINGYNYTKEQLSENKKALQATLRAFNLSSRQYNDGLVSYQRLLSTVEKLTLTQDAYAQIKGLLATEAVLIYKALGGGWQAQKNKNYLSDDMIDKLQSSGVDWGDYFKKAQKSE